MKELSGKKIIPNIGRSKIINITYSKRPINRLLRDHLILLILRGQLMSLPVKEISHRIVPDMT